MPFRGNYIMHKQQTEEAESVLAIGGRLSEAPSQGLVSAAFAEEVSGQRDLFEPLCLADIAHCLTLHEQGVIPADAARSLVSALLELRQESASFAVIPAYGDLYTNREVEVGRRTPAVGWLGVSRARREALTTAYHLLLRDRLIELGVQLLRFGRSLAQTARLHSRSLMPDYTYFQAAQPTSFGHYLSGFAWPVLRDLQRLESLYARADLCPAGCGSSNGSAIFQDRASQSRRLGCARPVAHARDAMWQADLAIEAMGLAAAAAVGQDRLAEDLLTFATAEFGFVQLSDRHARASKIMPQKRNPYALAYIRGLANRLIGEQAGVAASGRTPTGQMDSRMLPYQAVPAALASVAQAASLMAEVIEGLTFNQDRARAAMDNGAICASDLAERLCLGTGIDYRLAHAIVGRTISRLENQGRLLASLTGEDLAAASREAGSSLPTLPSGLIASALDPLLCVEARRDIGCAAPEAVLQQTLELADAFAQHQAWIEAARDRNAAAESVLLMEARAFAGETS
jgi:argininosuccinate lyase